MTLRYLSVCSGIEAATTAWHPLGWTPVAFAEIEKFPSAVLKHHYPHVPNLGDFTKIEASDVGPIDLLVGGTPCQSFSVAGKRLGMDDPRGNLALEFCALARRLQPRWLVWENVPGVHSSWSGAPDGGSLAPGTGWRGDEDSDFGAFLDALEECGYSACWRVLDAEYVRVDTHPRAVPQRRERVFVVGYLGDWRPAAAILLEPEGLRGDPPPRRQARQAVAGSLGAGSARSGKRVGRREAAANHLVAGTLNANGKAAGSATQQDAETNRLVAGTITGRSGNGSRQPGANSNIVASTVSNKWAKGRGGYAGQNETENCVMVPTQDPAHPLGACPGAFRSHGEGQTNYVAHSLRGCGFDASEDGTGRGTPIIAFDTTQITSKANRCQPEAGGTGHPLPAHGHAPALAFHARQDPDSGDVTHPLDTDGFSIGIQQAWAVRRLTPRECERLMGFPDDFTLITYRGKPAADGPRYRALGNSMAVNVMSWIGQRIKLFEEVT